MLPDHAWQIERRSWAEVPYVPSDGVAAKDRPAPPRYLVSRVSKKQGRLFADGGEVKHFAIVTNRPDPDGGSGLDLIRWQRGKAWPPGWERGPNPVPAAKRSSMPITC